MVYLMMTYLYFVHLLLFPSHDPAGAEITTGVQNTLLGSLAGDAITGGEDNVIIGYNSAGATNGDNQIVIGHDANAVGGSNGITLGDSSIGYFQCAIQTITALSDKRDKTNIVDSTYGLDFINNLKPVTFEWDHRAEVDREGVEFYSANKGKKDLGFIAQDLKELDDDYTQLVNEADPDKLGASYGRLIPIMAKAIQELSAKVKELENK